MQIYLLSWPAFASSVAVMMPHALSAAVESVAPSLPVPAALSWPVVFILLSLPGCLIKQLTNFMQLHFAFEGLIEYDLKHRR